MAATSKIKFQAFCGRSLDGLKLSDRIRLTGHWIATELYSPDRLPLRIIHAVGENAADCVRALSAEGLDPARYEYEPVPHPYES